MRPVHLLALAPLVVVASVLGLVAAACTADPDAGTLNFGGRDAGKKRDGSAKLPNPDTGDEPPADDTDTGAPDPDAGPGPAPDAAPASCTTTTSQGACLSCCVNQHPNGTKIYNDAFGACVCAQPGSCAVQCANETCVGVDPAAGDPCDQCLGNADCTGPIDTACSANGDCAALVACISDAGCGTK